MAASRRNCSGGHHSRRSIQSFPIREWLRAVVPAFLGTTNRPALSKPSDRVTPDYPMAVCLVSYATAPLDWLGAKKFQRALSGGHAFFLLGIPTIYC